MRVQPQQSKLTALLLTLAVIGASCVTSTSGGPSSPVVVGETRPDADATSIVLPTRIPSLSAAPTPDILSTPVTPSSPVATPKTTPAPEPTETPIASPAPTPVTPTSVPTGIPTPIDQPTPTALPPTSTPSPVVPTPTVQGPDRGPGPGDSEQQRQPPQGPDVYEEVWSQTSPIGTSWEYKVNCSGDPLTLEPCYLSDLTSVSVLAPDGSLHELEKDFNVNDYSGEVTRRWVLYGPQDGSPPTSGEYTFEYRQVDELVRSHTIDYTQSHISYPTRVEWQRVGNDIAVQWDAPDGVEEGMWYKVIIGNADGTPDAFVSQVFEWDSESATLPDIPLMDGGTYHLSVAVFYGGGYAYPEDEIFDW